MQAAQIQLDAQARNLQIQQAELLRAGSPGGSFSRGSSFNRGPDASPRVAPTPPESVDGSYTSTASRSGFKRLGDALRTSLRRLSNDSISLRGESSQHSKANEELTQRHTRATWIRRHLYAKSRQQQHQAVKEGSYRSSTRAVGLHCELVILTYRFHAIPSPAPRLLMPQCRI